MGFNETVLAELHHGVVMHLTSSRFRFKADEHLATLTEVEVHHSSHITLWTGF